MVQCPPQAPTCTPLHTPPCAYGNAHSGVMSHFLWHQIFLIRPSGKQSNRKLILGHKQVVRDSCPPGTPASLRQCSQRHTSLPKQEPGMGHASGRGSRGSGDQGLGDGASAKGQSLGPEAAIWGVLAQRLPSPATLSPEQSGPSRPGSLRL